MKTIAQIEITKHLYQEKVKPDVIAVRLGVHRATVYRWIKSIKKRGYKRTIHHYKNCKKGRRRKRILVETKKKIYAVREKYNDCCGEKIKYYLKRDYDIKVSRATIYRILNEKYKLSSKYKTRKYGEAPKGKKPREVIQTDTVDFGEVYAYTYIDTYTREVVIDLELDLESESGYASLTVAGEKFKQIELIQSDGGPEFKGEFRKNVLDYAKKYRESRPYKKNEQSFIESFNRTLRKECLGWRKYSMKELPEMKRKVSEFMQFYNYERPHLGLNMRTPSEIAGFCRI